MSHTDAHSGVDQIADVLPLHNDSALTAEPPDRFAFVTGRSFILDRPRNVPALWGDTDRVAWAQGEALMIAGPQGVGKTTIAGQLVRALLGLQAEVLGIPVAPARRVLYLAMDRPAQISRAFARIFTERDADALDRLVFFQGPPPADLAQHTDLLTEMAVRADANVVIVDSLKDAALGLSDDEVGSRWNRAVQKLLRTGRNVLVLHHLRKPGGATSGALHRRPEIADIYGSTWLTSGTGSVFMVTGSTGDDVVKLWHIKQPAAEIGPFTIRIDHGSGTMAMHESVDLVAAARRSGDLTVKVAASLLYPDEPGARKSVQGARRRLDSLVNDGRLVRREPPKQGGPITYSVPDESSKQ